MVVIFVIDCELFKRFKDGSSFPSSAEYIKFCEDYGFIEKKYIEECKYLLNLLIGIRKSKYKLAHNNIITNECLSIMLTCPPDIKKYYNRIISSPNCIKHSYTLTIHEKERFKDTILRDKVAYIDAAHKNEYKIIVTTEDFANAMEPQCYLYLAEYSVDYEAICDFCEEYNQVES